MFRIFTIDYECFKNKLQCIIYTNNEKSISFPLIIFLNTMFINTCFKMRPVKIYLKCKNVFKRMDE